MKQFMNDSDSLNGIVFILASIHSLFKGSIQPSNTSYSSPTDGDLRRLAKRYLYLYVLYATGRVICFDTAHRFPLEIGLWGDL